MSPKQTELYGNDKFEVTTERLCLELIERFESFDNVVILGIQPRGIAFATKIKKKLEQITGKTIPFGKLDVTFHRDDYRTKHQPILGNITEIDFLIADKHVVLIDDVLYKGRTVRAAMDAMLSFGRPASVELMVLIDRIRKREYPVEAAYIGMKIDTLNNQHVEVNISDDDSSVMLKYKSE